MAFQKEPVFKDKHSTLVYLRDDEPVSVIIDRTKVT